ncbi:MAG TPA: DUF262 domain-containing protein [Clostridia bacterium]|nr:DUF262 domain-containing protein [Clostridia bacterium]
MKIELNTIPIRDVVEGYVDNAEEGVRGYGGRLDIRPKYQREFVYKEEQRNAVIDTIRNDFPLNVMYWVKNEDGSFEVLDGQQRTISFCLYINNEFSMNIGGNPKYFHSLTDTEQEQLLKYELMIYFCEGNDKEKLDWFQTINIAGAVHTKQELLNAVYTGPWLADAKLKFSKSSCAAYLLAQNYVKGSPIRQEYLETALKWISKGNIEEYMSAHQHVPNANELWIYFRNVIEWVGLTFIKYRSIMKGLDWGGLYDEYKHKTFDTAKLEQEIHKLTIDDEVTDKKGIYYYVLTRDEKHLNLRAFTEAQKIAGYEKQKGICKKCGKHFELSKMEADHITPWSKHNPFLGSVVWLTRK